MAITNYAKAPSLWTGAGEDALWSNAVNWSSGSAPVEEDALVFSGTANLNPQNDLPADTLFTELAFENTDASFNLTGNRIILSGTLTNSTSVGQFVEMPLSLDGTVLITNTASTATLALDGNLTGDGSFIKKGLGLLEITGTNDFNGTKTVDQGSVLVSGDQSAATATWQLRGYGATGTTFGSAATTVTFAEDSTIYIDAGSGIQAGHTAAVGGTSGQAMTSAGTVTNDGTLTLARSGSLTLNGGSWTQNGPVTIATQGGGQATLNLNAGASFTYTNTQTLALNTSLSNNTRTRININGGTFTTGATIHNNTVDLSPLDTANSDIILANGGTLRLSAGIDDLFTTAGANIRFQLGTDGGTIDTNGFDSTLNVAISGEGGLTKSGAGTLTTTEQNSYTGSTTVLGGTLAVSAPALADEAAVTVASGATLQLDFTGQDTVAGLTLGETALPDGTYDATTHPAFLSGTGQLVVVNPIVTPDETFASWATDLGLSGDPTADFDGDGLADSLEFVLGTDPKAANSGSPLAISQDSNDFIVTFSREDRSETPDLTLTVEAGEELATWPRSFTVADTTENSSAGVTVVENAEAADTITVRIPKLGAQKLFSRIKVAITPAG